MDSITLTFGDVAENHIGNEQIGQQVECGISCEQLEAIHQETPSRLIDLSLDGIEASVLVVDRVDDLMGYGFVDSLLDEQRELTPDKHFWNRRSKSVCNKRARWNLCFNDTGHDADYEKGLGTVVAFDDVPRLEELRQTVMKLVDATDLKVEGNYYYDIEKCGISYHGDTERRLVVGVRLGKPFPLCYRWYQDSKPIGDRIDIDLPSGSLYIMSDKAVGWDWRKRSLKTLRHSAGCNKYIQLKTVKPYDANLTINPDTGRSIKVGGPTWKRLKSLGKI